MTKRAYDPEPDQRAPGCVFPGAVPHLIALTVVVAVMVVGGWSLLSQPVVPAYVDHPYKFQQQQSFSEALSQGRDPLGWTQEFSGGYPELQFYPPGTAGLGAIYGLVPGVDSEHGYWLVLVTAWFAPAVAAWATLALIRSRPPVAALGGVAVGVVHFGNSGTFGGVGVGVLASRLSLAACILAVGLFLKATAPEYTAGTSSDTSGARQSARPKGLLIGIALAMMFATFMHLYFVPIAVIAMVWLAWRQRGCVGANVRALLAATAGILGAGVWWWGTLALASLTVPYRPTDIDPWRYLVNPFVSQRFGLDWALLLVVGSWAFVRTRRQLEPRPFLLVAIVGPVLIAQMITIVTDLAMNIKLVSSVRVLDATIFVLLLTTPLVLETFAHLRDDPPRLTLIVTSIGVVWFAFSYPVLLPPEIGVSLPGYQLAEQANLWQQLREGTGRVVFTSNNFGKSHIGGFAYRASGREPLNGGPTTASPMQAQLLNGPGASGIEHLGEVFNNKVIFGLKWRDMQGDRSLVERLSHYLQRLGVTQIVAVADDVNLPGLPALVMEKYPDRFRRRDGPPSGVFIIFDVAGAVSARVVPDGPGIGVGTIVQDSVGIRTQITSTQSSQILIHELRSPYWRITLDGQEVIAGEDEFHEMTVPVKPGEHTLRADLVTPTNLVVGRVALVVGALALLSLVLFLPDGAGARGRSTTQRRHSTSTR